MTDLDQAGNAASGILNSTELEGPKTVRSNPTTEARRYVPAERIEAEQLTVTVASRRTAPEPAGVYGLFPDVPRLDQRHATAAALQRIEEAAR
jgi:hypothetical protein